MWPPLDPKLARGRLKRRRVQCRWGLRRQRQPDEDRPQRMDVDKAERGQGEEEEEEEAVTTERSGQVQQRARKRRRAASPAEPGPQRRAEAPQLVQAAPAASGTAAAGAAAAVPRGGSGPAAGAEAGEVPLPVVLGVPAGLVQQLALLPCSRPPCGCCSACAVSSDRGCRLVAALKRWDALLPGLSLSDLQQLKQAQQRCGRCRSCLVATHAVGGAGGKKRRKGGAVCMALSRVRLGRLQQKLEQLVQERQAWASSQELRQQRLAGRQQRGAASDREANAEAGIDPDADADADASPASSSGSGCSNHSRAWLRSQRKRGQQWQQPLPAPDGSLPLPVVPGVPWQRTCELAEAWGEGPPGRCGLCAGCRQQQAHKGGESDDSVPRGQVQTRCTTAAALVAWDRQLGPVTTAAVQAVAALPAAQRKEARCGCCRQCRLQGGKAQQCATARKLQAGTLPPRLQQAVQQAAAAQAQQAEEHAAGHDLPNGRRHDTPNSSTTSESTRAGSGEASGHLRRRSSSGTGSEDGYHSRRSRQSPDVSSRTVSQSRSRSTLSRRHRQGSLSLLGSSNASDTSSSGAGSESEPEGQPGSPGSSCSEEEDARWLPWLRFYLPWSQRAAAGDAGPHDAQLGEARLLVRRRRERELRRLLQGRQDRRRTGIGKLQAEAWDLRGQPHMRQLMLAEARCLAAELGATLEGVTEWRCSAQILARWRRRGGHPRLGGGSGSDEEGVVVCGFRHRLRDNAWHLWKCSACGAPRWEGPGFQLEQRLAAALQAGAALGASLLPLPGGDGPAAAAAAAAAAALARFRWEAGEAGTQPAGYLPDADHAEEAGEAAVALLSGLPRFELEEEFEGLAELAADMLLHSRAALGCGAAAAAEQQREEQRLSAEQRLRCRSLRRSGLGRAAKRLELAALRLVEEQEGLVAAARQRQPRRQPQPAPLAPSQGAPVLPPWQLGDPAGAAAADGSMERAELAGGQAATERQHLAASQPSGEGQDAGGQSAAGAAGAVLPYHEYVEQALLLLGQDGGGAAGDSDGEQAQEQRRLLQLCDELYYMPHPDSTAGMGSDPSRAALARLRGMLEQQRGLGLAGSTGQLQAGGAVSPASNAGHELALQQPGSGLEQQNAGCLAGQVGSRAAGHQQAQAPSPLQPSQQPSPFGSVLSQPTLPNQLGPLPMSQADDNMPDAAAAAAAAAAARAEDAADAAGIAGMAFTASQQGEAGGSQGAEPGDLLGGLPLLIGTEASQPDPLQQEAAAAEQLLQRELLDLRQRQQERRQQLREERERAEQQRRQREEQVAAQAAASAEQRQAEQPADDVHRDWRLAAASEATFHCVWRLLGELLRGVLSQHVHQPQRDGRAGGGAVRLHLPPPQTSLLASRAEWPPPAQPLQGSCGTLPAALARGSWGPAGPAAVDASGPPAAPAGWVAWQSSRAGDASPALALKPRPPAPASLQGAVLRSIPRFVPLTESQPGRGPPAQRTLHALLPPALLPLPAGTVPQQQQGGAGTQAAAALEAEEKASKRRPRGRWVAAVDEEEDAAAVEQRRRLVATHPQLLLLLEHPKLQRCGACAACRGATAAVPKGVARHGRSSRRACLNRQRFVHHYQRQRQRAQQAEEAAATGGGSSSAPALPHRSARAAHPLATPLSAGVPESAALRVAAAYKLLYPGWEPSFLTEERLAGVAAALPAAVAALQRRNGAGGGEQGSSEGSGDERRQERPARGQGNFFQRKQHERMQRLLGQLRGEEEFDGGGPTEGGRQQGAQQQQQQAGSSRAEVADEGSPGDLPLTQPCGTQLDSSQIDGTQLIDGSTPGWTQLPPSQLGSQLEGGNTPPPPAALGRQGQRHGRPQMPQQQGWVPGRAGSAFVSVAGPAAGAASASPSQRATQQRTRQLQLERGLEEELRQLPPDVQLAFRAGLSAGLPEGAVAAAVQRYQSLTTSTSASGVAAVNLPPGGSGSGSGSAVLAGKGCDDDMGPDDHGVNPANLLLISLPHPRKSTPPSAQSWVAPIVKPTISNRSFLKQVFTFQGAHPSSCSLKSFTYEKLCVPKNNKPGAFRAKVRIVPNEKACGEYMFVKMRFSSSGEMYLWGRSASR
ncbi:hypothetical protein ABPG77_011373 [Micractinium sp. CCAP 211/92]